MHFEVFFSTLARRADVAIADRQGALSGFDLAHEVTARAAELARQGVGVTTPVLVRVSNDINSVISLLAVWSLDALAFVGNPFTPVEEVARTVDRFGISHVLGDAPSVKAIHAMSGGASVLFDATVADRQALGVRFPAQAHRFLAVAQDLGHANVAIFSSGTTGEPKAILNTFDRISQNACAHARSIGLHAGDVIGCVLPIFFSYGLVANLIGGLVSGAKVVLQNQIASMPQDWLEQHQVSVVGLTPFLTKNLGADVASCLRTITIGGDVLHAPVAAALHNRLAHLRIYSTYGLTEAGPRVATWRVCADALHSELVVPLGSPIDCCEFDIAVHDAASNVGELIVRTHTHMLGYLHGLHSSHPFQPQLGDVVHTGDLFQRVDGRLHFMGRQKDVIVQAGEKIFPAAIESIIAGIDGVHDVRVMAEADQDRGEVAVANIQSDAHISLSDVRKVLLRHMPPNTIPKVINFVDRIERTETGKKKRLTTAL